MSISPAAWGCNSTARDYARFEQMLLNGGQLNGRRVLSPRAVELMRSNYTDGLYHGMRGTEDGVGFGLGIAVTLDETRARLRRSEGSAGWEGAFGTMSWNDPREEIVGVIMLQQNARARSPGLRQRDPAGDYGVEPAEVGVASGGLGFPAAAERLVERDQRGACAGLALRRAGLRLRARCGWHRAW